MKKGYKNNICLSTNATPKGIIYVFGPYFSEYWYIIALQLVAAGRFLICAGAKL